MSGIKNQAAPANSPEAATPAYLVVTPCRDEADFLDEAIRSVCEQTARPTLWVIVDDGSTDRTPEILLQASERHEFIRIIRREDRGARLVGPGVIDAFYAGLESAGDLSRFEFLCKLDADLIVPPRYFERLLKEMAADPCLGSVSGKVFIVDSGGSQVHERRGDEAAVGPSKFYRRAAFEDIGGFARVVGWDGIDGHMCRQHGWVARSIMDDELRLLHRRQMGSSERGVITGRIRGGRGKWRIGSSPLYVLATSVYRLVDPPPVVGSLAMIWGYLHAMVTGEPRFGDRAYRRALRRYEWQCLLRGKRRATRLQHDRIRREAGKS